MFKRFYIINTQQLIATLLLTVLTMTPIFSFQESMALIFGGLTSNSSALTSPYVKSMKDLFSILIIFASILLIIKKNRITNIQLYSLFSICLVIILPAFYYHSNIIIFLSGIRWLMPFILALFLIGNIDKELLHKMAIILFWLFIFHFILQIFQLFFAGGWFGINSFGLSSRNPGLFFIPSTAAVFTILVLFFSKFYMDKKLERKIFFLIPISLLLTSSGTGIGIYIVFMTIYYLKKKYLPLMPLILIFLAIFLIFTLDVLSARTGLLEDSFGARLIMFQDVFNEASFLPTNFGFGTSTGYLIANKYNLDFDMAVTDSWYATVIVNLGLINSLIIAIFLLISFTILTVLKNKEIIIFFIIYALSSATTVFTESYPANIIFSILLAYYIKSKESLHETSNNTQ